MTIALCALTFIIALLLANTAWLKSRLDNHLEVQGFYYDQWEIAHRALVNVLSGIHTDGTAVFVIERELDAAKAEIEDENEFIAIVADADDIWGLS